MLVGIVKKNAIMMIDFALEARRTEDISPAEAISRRLLVRFRPIMMTTMAALMATLPIALGFGAGARVAPAAGPRGGRRACWFPASDALYHPGDLYISGIVRKKEKRDRGRPPRYSKEH